MTSLKEFTQSAARPLPVVIVADVSGSMSVDGKIQSLNQAIQEMLSAFAASDEVRAEIHVGVVAFGGESAWMHVNLQPATAVQWQSMQADGRTPMGAALGIAADLIENKDAIPSRAYRPTVVLISDGVPTDDWKRGLTRFTGEGRANKAERLALAIGADADEAMLGQFVSDPKHRVFHAEDAARIRQFFRFVTMSVTSRSKSADPNAVPPLGDDPYSLDNL
jgi:uncharacterized protein YegL